MWNIWKIIANFCLVYGNTIEHQENEVNYKAARAYLNIFFPSLPVDKVNIASNNRDKKYTIYGLFTGEDVNYISAHLLSSKKEEEEFWNFINNQPIHTNLIEYIFFLDKQLFPLTFVDYFIQNKGDINITLLKNIKNIKPNIRVQECKIKEQHNYVIKFTSKEKMIILRLFKTNKHIKNLWFIYKNFDKFYGKHFVFFSIDQRELSKEKAKEYFYWLFMSFVYDTILSSLY